MLKKEIQKKRMLKKEIQKKRIKKRRLILLRTRLIMIVKEALVVLKRKVGSR